MALAHLCKDPEYVNNFRTIREEGGYVYLDNSQYELGYSLPIEKVLEAAFLINANCVILPDGDLTHLEEVKYSGFDVMYIPADPDLEKDFIDAMFNKKIDVVGLSYSKVATYMGRARHCTTSRFDFLTTIGEMLPNKKIHMLGMATPGEIALMRPFRDLILSWDTSIAIWAGLNHIDIRDMKHKNTRPVDFDSDLHWGNIVDSNIEYINKLLSL
jgi:hypothetical protein